MKKKLALILAVGVLSVLGFTGCYDTRTTNDETTEMTTEITTESEVVSLTPEQKEEVDEMTDPELPQLAGVQKGDTIATIHTTKGDIKVWFFPDYAPKAVENFTTHAKDGYYNNVTFHRVIEDFMIQSGDPTGTGMGGESIWGDPFEVEPSYKLRHFRGALCMAKTSEDVSIGSQFYIVQNNGPEDTIKSQLEQLKNMCSSQKFTDGENVITYGDILFPEKVIDAYLENGGSPTLDFQYTVFGQVYEGMDVVDAIATAEKQPVSDSSETPSKLVDDVIITSIDVGTYEG